jgi:molecular chaperone DnaJ
MDYYELLKISKNADEITIRKAYKLIACEWHPDKHLIDKEFAENKFKEINEAYQILSDLNKKEEYDKKNGFNKIDFLNNIVNKILLNSIKKPDPIMNVKIILELSFEEIFYGVSKNIKINRMSLCKNCSGLGSYQKKDFNCVNCDGNGFLIGFVNINMYTFCQLCYGTGIDISKICIDCKGNKCCIEEIEYIVDIPKGIVNEYIILLKSHGNLIPNKSGISNRSDVEITIKEQKHNLFYRDIDNPSVLKLDMYISLAESLCGFNKNINYFDNNFVINSKKIIKNEDIFIIKAKGMPIFNKDGYFGEMHIIFKIIY